MDEETAVEDIQVAVADVSVSEEVEA